MAEKFIGMGSGSNDIETASYWNRSRYSKPKSRAARRGSRGTSELDVLPFGLTASQKSFPADRSPRNHTAAQKKLTAED
jgi:hypothetical protein